jgi:hypothetical protein
MPTGLFLTPVSRLSPYGTSWNFGDDLNDYSASLIKGALNHWKYSFIDLVVLKQQVMLSNYSSAIPRNGRSNRISRVCWKESAYRMGLRQRDSSLIQRQDGPMPPG